jgi:CheY-like chemotaxis protein
MSNQKDVRVLVVEDNPSVSDTIQTMLKEMGYTVAGKATDGKSAIQMTNSLQPDVILMDVGMPHMDGIQATQHIQASCPTPVVVLTAHEPSELVGRAGVAGVGAYLVKPPKAPEIERAHALDQVKILRGLLPICMGCKRIRDDDGYWQQLETYIRDRSEAEFSHGLCPDCAEELYPGLFKADG